MKNTGYKIFIILVFALLLVPFAGMSFWATNETTENTELAGWPALTEDGKWNEAYLSEMGEYFEDHFAFRQYFVTANALLRGKVLKSSATDQVVVGTDDWLYYSGTLDDYCGTELLSERELYAVVHNLKLMQDYVESCGSRFILTVAPNKNSLYNKNMPYYYRKGTDSNLKHLTEKMSEAGISYVNLYQLFAGQDEMLYFKRDSHWNNQGAVLAYNALMDQMEKEHETYLNVPYELEKTHIGDIDEMLYPLAAEPEEDYIYDKESGYTYVNDVTDNMDDWIETQNPGKEGTLLMFRDSFGESLLPFMADEVGRGYFSRLVPYNLTQVEEYHPDYVIVERVERKISAFAEEAPIMEGPMTAPVLAPEAETGSTLETEKQGSYLTVKGKIDERYMETGTEIFVSVRDNASMDSRTYQAFYTVTDDGDGNGYQLYLKGGSVPAGDIHISVIVQNEKQNTIVVSKDIIWN